ncbi:MAG: D-alanyl-D-alanine carboxypeptidase [Reichenbachiella sp.]
MKKRYSFWFLALIITVISFSCTVLQKQSLKKSLSNSDFFNSHFTGFILADPLTNTTLFEFNSDKYFVPASNAKLLTYYTALVSLQDSIPGIRYETVDDTLYFKGTGDPTFLHPDFPNQPVFEFLNNSPYPLVYVESDFADVPQAPGWTWEDYQHYYQPERNDFPMYGNTVSFEYNERRNKFKIEPGFFKDFTEISEKDLPGPARHRNSNIFNFSPDTSRSDYKNRVPFKTSEELVVTLLKDTLNKDVKRIKSRRFINDTIKYSQPARPVYTYMLKKSDNFCAEQLLYSCTIEQGIAFNSAIMRKYMSVQYFDNVSGKPKWKDGSGLSRYNLMTPRFLVDILKKIEQETSIEEMKRILPIGGVDGTIKDWYEPRDGESPYVFAKTGTLSNNHNLTGVITTQSGNDLFFSFMNNNYPSSSYPVKMQMEKVLRTVYENY